MGKLNSESSSSAFYRKIALLFSLLFVGFPAICCTTCNREVQGKIYDESFMPNLFIMLSAFIVLGIIVAILSYLSAKSYNKSVSANPGIELLNPVPLTTAAMVLGIGLGGFIDGIVLHQILQWHEMLSNRLPPVTVVAKSVNMFWDGIFHLFNWLVVLLGVILQWRLLKRKNINRSGKLLSGGLLAGWGLFNIVEGVIDHQILKIHNVREITENPEVWNVGFLVISVLMLLVGYGLIKKGSALRQVH